MKVDKPKAVIIDMSPTPPNTPDVLNNLEVDRFNKKKYPDDILNLIKKWRLECVEKREIHKNLSKKYNRKYLIYGSIPIILPFMMTFASQTIEDEDALKIVSGIGFMTVGIVSGMLSFLQLKVKAVTHHFSDYEYNRIINFIDASLSSNSIPADIMVVRLRTELRNLDLYSPRQDGCLSDICCCK